MVVSTQIFTHCADRPRAKPTTRYVYLSNVGPSTIVTTPPMSSQRAIHSSLVSRLTPCGVTTAARPKPTADVITSRVTLPSALFPLPPE